MKFISIFLILFVLCLTGCYDPMCGYSKIVEAPTNLPMGTVEKTLKQIPDVDVEVTQVKARTSWSLYEGSIEHPGYHHFCISNKTTFTNLTITNKENDQCKIEFLYLSRGSSIDESTLKEAIILMDFIYNNLLETFPNLPPHNSFKEKQF